VKQLLSATQLDLGVRALAGRIAADYSGRRPTVIGVLTGSIVFMADMIRQIDLPLRIGLVAARSYRGAATRPGPIAIHADLVPDIAGHDVLIVDDIFDTGRTLLRLYDTLAELKPASIRSAVLLRKPARAEVNLMPDYVAFDIPDQFVVGYGLDYQDAYRNLPYVAALEEHELAEASSRTGAGE
jgi:hypoxanthine phosphoribosyltransferase